MKRIPIDVPTPAGSLNIDYVWQTAAASGLWKEGKTISYWIEAEDNNDVTGPGIGKSGKRQWRVVTVEEKKKELTDKLSQDAEKLEQDSIKEDDQRKATGELIKTGRRKITPRVNHPRP